MSQTLLTRSTPSAQLVGSQRPSLLVAPPRVSSAGDDAIELAESFGLVLDEWQQFAVRELLGEREDGSWAARKGGLIVPRQNGKGEVLEVIELAGLLLHGEKVIIHSAHLYPTSREAFLRAKMHIENSSLVKLFKKPRMTNGEQGLETLDGRRLQYMSRTKGGGRGFSGDRIILDEAYDIPDLMVNAIEPTMSARPNGQLLLASTTPGQIVENSGYLRRTRATATSADPGRLTWVEWSCDPDDNPDDVDVWVKTNPALGIRITLEAIEGERASMSDAGFRTERLGLWPAEADHLRVIPESWWQSCEDTTSEISGRVSFTFDVSPDRGTASIAVAGKNDQGVDHIELVDRRAGTGWLLPRLVELADRHEGAVIGCDPVGPAGGLLADLRAAGLEVTEIKMAEYGRACGLFYDLIASTHEAVAVGGLGSLRHIGQPELGVALANADRRPMGDAWAWSRKTSAADITCLVAVTLALHLSRGYIEPPPPERRPVFAL